MSFPAIQEMLHDGWGPNRIVALGGLRPHRQSGMEFGVEVVLHLDCPPTLLAGSSVNRVVITVPVGLLPWLVVGAEFEAGVLVGLPRGLSASIVASHSLTPESFTLEPLRAIALSDEWARSAPPAAESVGLRTKTVLIPMMRLSGPDGGLLLPTWEAIRAFYAWTTTLAHHIVSGATGASLASRLGWQPPTQLTLASPTWPELVAPGKYRIRLRSGTDQSKETATMVAMSELVPRVSQAVSRVQSSLSRPNSAIRYPETLLPCDHSTRLEVLIQSDSTPRRVQAITAADWTPPFDALDLLTADLDESQIIAPTRPGAVRRSAVDSLTGQRPSRGDVAKTGLIRAPMASLAETFTRRVTIVPRLGMTAGEIRHYLQRVPVGSLTFGTSSTTDAVVPRGVALTGRQTSPSTITPASAGDGDLAPVSGVLGLALEAISVAKRLAWDRVATALRPMATLGALAGQPDLAGLRGRHLTVVDVGINEWAASIVDLERYAGDSAHRRHGLAIVLNARGDQLAPSGMLATALLASRGRIPSLRAAKHADFQWCLVRHPRLGDDIGLRRAALVQRLVRHLVRQWTNALRVRA